MRRLFFLLTLVSGSAFAQIGAGFKGGVPFTDLFRGSQGTTTYQTETKRYIVGGMVELRLPAGISIEGDALYTNASFSSFSSAFSSNILDANSWEFPVVLKKKFGGPDALVASARPYIEAGASFRRIGGLSTLPSFVTGSGQVDKNNTGFVIGGGVEFRALFLRISPEIRFTRWGSDNFLGGLATAYKTNRNQGQFLVGFSF